MNFFRNSLGLYERSGSEIKYKADFTVAGHKIKNINNKNVKNKKAEKRAFLRLKPTVRN